MCRAMAPRTINVLVMYFSEVSSVLQRAWNSYSVGIRRSAYSISTNTVHLVCVVEH